MRTDTRKVKQRLLERDNFTREQAEDLVEAFFEDDDPVVTRSVLRDKLRRFTLRIVLANAAVMAALLRSSPLRADALGLKPNLRSGSAQRRQSKTQNRQSKIVNQDGSH